MINSYYKCNSNWAKLCGKSNLGKYVTYAVVRPTRDNRSTYLIKLPAPALKRRRYVALPPIDIDPLSKLRRSFPRLLRHRRTVSSTFVVAGENTMKIKLEVEDERKEPTIVIFSLLSIASLPPHLRLFLPFVLFLFVPT